MLEKIQSIFNRVTGRTDIILTEKTSLKNEAFSLSSYTLIQLICALEDEFDIEIPNSEIKKIKTIKDFIVFIEKNS